MLLEQIHYAHIVTCDCEFGGRFWFRWRLDPLGAYNYVTSCIERVHCGVRPSMLARMCWRAIPCIESRPLFCAPKMGRAQANGYEMEHTNLNYWERMGGCEEI